MTNAVLTLPNEDQLAAFMYSACRVNRPVAITAGDGLCYVLKLTGYNITDSAVDSQDRVIEIPAKDAYIIDPNDNRFQGLSNGQHIMLIKSIKEVRLISQETYGKLTEFSNMLFARVDRIYECRDVLNAYGLHDDADKENELAERIWNEHNKIDFELV